MKTLTPDQTRFIAAALIIAADSCLHDSLTARDAGNMRIAGEFAREGQEALDLAKHIDGNALNLPDASTLYRVTWTIDIDADNPEMAARKALRIQRDPNSIATVFDVTIRGPENIRVDLGEAGTDLTPS